jgi:hypothetical protein
MKQSWDDQQSAQPMNVGRRKSADCCYGTASGSMKGLSRKKFHPSRQDISDS